MADHTTPPEAEVPPSSAVLPPRAAPRLRTERFLLVVETPEEPVRASRLRKQMAELGVSADLLDDRFVRRLVRATETLVQAALDDEAILEQLAVDPVRAYRTVDADVADRLTEIDRAARTALRPPPDLGPHPAQRRAAPLPRPEIRAAAVESAVADLQHAALTWAGQRPANLARLQEDPDAVLGELAADAPPTARRRLAARLRNGRERRS